MMRGEVKKSLQQFRNELFGAVAKNPSDALELVLYLRRRNEQVPDILIQSLTSVQEPDGDEPTTGLARKAAEDYITTDEAVPPALLNKVATNDKDAYYLALHYKKFDQQVPTVILKAVQNSPRWSSVFSTQIRRMSQEENEEMPLINLDDASRQQVLASIMRDYNVAIKYVGILTKNKKPIPENLKKMFTENPEKAEMYASVVFGNGGIIPDDIMNELIKDPSKSFNLANHIFGNFKNVLAPEPIVRGIAKSSSLSSEYAVMILKEKILNHKFLKILENGIAKGSTTEKRNRYGYVSVIHAPESAEKVRTKAADDYAMVYSRIIGEIPSDTIMKMVSDSGFTYVASNLVLQQKDIPEQFVKKISKNPDQSYRFIGRYYLKFGSRILPKKYKSIMLAAKKYEKEHI
jgi:hypothetical protein